MTDKVRGSATGGRGGRILMGATLGLLAAGAGLAGGELVAGFTGPATSPVLAVGAAAIDLTPTPIKDFAIRTFGTADKLVLVSGVLAVLAVTAAAAGVLARRRFALGGALVIGFAAVGVAAAATRPGAGLPDVLPSVVAGVIALAALRILLDSRRRANRGAGERTGTSRRSVLRAGLATMGFAAVAAVTGRILQARRGDVAASRAAVRLPRPAGPAAELPAGYRAKVAGLGPFFTPNREFYRVDTALTLPAVRAEDWTLRIGGDVRRPIVLSFDDLLSRELTERDLTLSCVSNEVGGPYVGTARWLGVGLGDLLREAGVRQRADQLLSTSADGMTIGTPMGAVLDGRDALLAIGMNGEPLPIKHGFPARMLVPGLYGYTSATKWVVELRATRFDAEQAYWTQRDWDTRGFVKTSSRIDVPRSFARVAGGDVVVAGVAWAQHRGISTVQVRMDGGRWQDAELTKQVSADTWRQWRTTFRAGTGTRRFEVRAADGNGDMQPEQRAKPFPNGSSGWHSVAVTVTP